MRRIRRRNLRKSYSNRLFRRTARRVHRRNLIRAHARGGFRL